MTVVSGERRFAAEPERVFELLVDPDVVVSALPAVRSHRALDGDRFEAKVKVPLPLAPSVTIHFEVLERRPPEHASVRAHGAGTDVRSAFDLAPDENGGTVMRWYTELHVVGVLGRLAGHGLDVVAHRQAERSLDAVERALSR
jgi:carbon monoxide dehydrogenase subunit G